MDFFRTVLCMGLVALLWNARVGSVQPVRDFVLWGLLYPFHFILMALLILVIWGVAGASYGLQSLFLGDNALIQILVGATVMLLFAALILHYSVLDPPKRWRDRSLKTLVSVLRELNGLMPVGLPLNSLLCNGFLERLDRNDIKAIHDAIGIEEERDPVSPPLEAKVSPQWAELDAMLMEEPFRLLVSPAILVVKGLMLVILIGVVPSIVIPSLNRDPIGFAERLPWLVGVILGYVFGVVVACWTTRWAAQSAGWETFEERLIREIRAWAGSVERAELRQVRRAVDAAPASEASSRAQPDEGPTESTGEARSARWNWLSFLTVFFVFHFVVNILLPDRLTSQWIDWPERTFIAVPDDAGIPRMAPDRWKSFPWLPMAILLAEAIAAAITLASLRAIPSLRLHSAAATVIHWFHSASQAVARLILLALAYRSSRLVVFVTLPILAILVSRVSGLQAATSPRSLLNGLWGAVFLGTLLSLWLLGFRIATTRDDSSDSRGRTRRILAASAIVSLVLLYLGNAGDLLVQLLATVVLVIAIVELVPPELRIGRTRIFARTALAVMMSVLGMGSILAVGSGWNPSLLTAVWVASVILTLGASSMSGLGRWRPSLLFPLTLILAFVAFAIGYNALDEPWQSAMPSAGSIACMIGLIAAIYTVIAFTRPKSGLLTAIAIIAGIVVLKGNAWFVAPNEFKSTFPNMESYYALPIRLDSKDYIRDTTPSTVRLANRKVLEDFDRLQQQGKSERLATAYARVEPLRVTPDGKQIVTVTVEDQRGRLRATVGDTFRIASEEYYTTLIEGNDCVVLAEEPFYRKIFRYFRYDNLSMVRDGIIRGEGFPLVPMDAASAAPNKKNNSGKPGITLYEAIEGPGDRLGLKLIDLAAAYRAAQAQYVLISMYWSGRVAAVEHSSHLDVYTAEFEIPAGAIPLDDSEIKNLNAWLNQCHLDTVRRSQIIEADRKDQSQDLVQEAAKEQCLVLEDARGEAPVPVAMYLGSEASDPSRFPDFAPFRATRENVAKAIEQTPSPTYSNESPAEPPDSQKFTLRPAHDRGLFASLEPRTLAIEVDLKTEDRQQLPLVALYNAGRIRPGDRIIASWDGQWHEPGGMKLRNGGLFEVRDVGVENPQTSGADRLPGGYLWCRLLPIAKPFEDRNGAPNQGKPETRKLVVGQWEILKSLNNTEVLLAWKRLVDSLWKEKRPKLVLVTVSGGGIRASVWTSVVLRKLEATLGAEFPYHIRLITGASGGMVGGSYYATSLGPPPMNLLGGRLDFSALHGATIDQFVENMATDQLDAVAGRLAFADLLSAFNPFLQQGDRGKTLEETWIRWTGGARSSPLARPLQSYAADERWGWRPSLIYTPMMVEDGRRILVSNLDLAFATRNVGGLLIEPSSRKIERFTFQGEDLDQSIHNEDDIFSLSAVEFYRLFPEAHDFRVTTAVRMSATFPWVTPAVNLPTLPPRRVVDAGYYDNYGVNLAALWLAKMRSWLEANTSGVVVIQIRDHVSQESRTEMDFDRVTGSSTLDRLTWRAARELLIPGLQAFSTPLLGISTAREWTMSFRNDEQVDLMDLLFDDNRGRGFFRTVVFECPVEVSLNWTLSDRERDVLTGGFGHAETSPENELSLVKDYMTGRDAYEFRKWKIANRNKWNFETMLKAKYDEQLANLGCRGMSRMTAEQSQKLYENVVKNLKRLQLLQDWWSEGRRQP